MVVLLAGSALAGCGFQLRGQAQLPPAMANTYVDYAAVGLGPNDPLPLRLRQTLISNGVTVSDNAEAASARLQILNADYGRRTLATGRRGAVREYRLTYRLRFALFGADNTPLQNPDEVRVDRDVLYDETQVLGTEAGLNIAREQLINDAVDALLRRLQY